MIAWENVYTLISDNLISYSFSILRKQLHNAFILSREGAGRALAPPELVRSVNYIKTREQIIPLTLLPPPRIHKAIYTSVV